MDNADVVDDILWLEARVAHIPYVAHDEAFRRLGRLRANLTDPGYVRVPVELIETLRDMSDRHIRIGTVLTVDMNDIALHLDMLAAAQETPND